MRRAVVWSVLSMILLGVPVGAAAQDATQVPNPLPPPTPEPERSPEDVERRSHVIARVGDVTITVGEVEDAVNEQSPFIRARYRDPAQLRAFADSMVRFELLARAAERAETDEDPDVRHVVRQNAVQQLIRREFDERLRPDTVDAAAVRNYYDTNPQEFTQDEMRRASHIQLATREEADRLMDEAREADARAFRALAREHSVDPETRLRGGDLRYFDDEGHPRNQRDPQVDEAIAQAAFGLEEVGDVAGPVQVGERWSIVKLTGRRPAQHRTLEQAEPTIRLRLWRTQRQQEMEDFVARLRREAHVEVHHDRIRNIRLDEPDREDRDEAAEESPGALRTRRPRVRGVAVEAPPLPSAPAPAE